MEFHPLTFKATTGTTPAGGPAAPTAGRGSLAEGAQNLLKHIPGEASGFYLLSVEAMERPGLGRLAFVAVLALILLVVVRKLAGASHAVMGTTIGAFALWMAVLDQGVLHQAFPTLLPDPMGLILAVFYSALITALANAGKIR